MKKGTTSGPCGYKREMPLSRITEQDIENNTLHQSKCLQKTHIMATDQKVSCRGPQFFCLHFYLYQIVPTPFLPGISFFWPVRRVFLLTFHLYSIPKESAKKSHFPKHMVHKTTSQNPMVVTEQPCYKTISKTSHKTTQNSHCHYGAKTTPPQKKTRLQKPLMRWKTIQKTLQKPGCKEPRSGLQRHPPTASVKSRPSAEVIDRCSLTVARLSHTRQRDGFGDLKGIEKLCFWFWWILDCYGFFDALCWYVLAYLWYYFGTS